MVTAELVSREGDLTTHICYLCGFPIAGDAILVEANGGRRYCHAGPCNVGLVAERLDGTGDPEEVAL